MHDIPQKPTTAVCFIQRRIFRDLPAELRFFSGPVKQAVFFVVCCDL